MIPLQLKLPRNAFYVLAGVFVTIICIVVVGHYGLTIHAPAIHVELVPK
jgi:hypothetical protein